MKKSSRKAAFFMLIFRDSSNDRLRVKSPWASAGDENLPPDQSQTVGIPAHHF